MFILYLYFYTIYVREKKMKKDLLFNVIEINKIQATPMPINKNSHKVFKKNGFALEGTLRQKKNGQGPEL